VRTADDYQDWHAVMDTTLRPSRRALLGALAGIATGACARRPASGTVRVGSSATGVPFSFVDPWSNELTGFMVDTVTLVAATANLPIELEVVPFSALIPSLLAHRIDMIAAAMLRTPQRAQVAAFSNPVFSYGGGLVVAASNHNQYRSLTDARHLRVGAQVGTRFTDQALAAGIQQVPTYDNLADMLRDLSHGRIDAVYGDAPILAYHMKTGARPNLRMVKEFVSPAEEPCCLILRRDDPRIGAVNAAIDPLRTQRIPALARHWGLA
jgi:polar amino acid transport system substrate-binding protein